MKLVNREWGLDAGGTPGPAECVFGICRRSSSIPGAGIQPGGFENGEIFYRTPGGWVSK